MNLRKVIVELAGNPIKRLVAKWWIKNKSDEEIIKLIRSQNPRDVLLQQKKVAGADILVFITQIFWLHFPAIVKGWMERVLTYGFAYKLSDAGWKGDPDGRINFHSILSVGAETRKKYLEIAYLKGKEL
jgi:NAD(P)H dehydrogenase (quinone)